MQVQKSQEDKQQSTVSRIQNCSNKFSVILSKTNLLLKLESDNLLKQGQIQSIAQVNQLLLQNIFQIFSLREKEQCQQRMMDKINTCDNLIKLFQIKIIDVVQIILKTLNQTPQNTVDSQQYRKQFYKSCNYYFNRSYQHFNRLCLKFSKQTQLNSDFPKNENIPNMQQSGIQSNNSYALKDYLSQIMKVKKNYQMEVLVRQGQVKKYQDQIKEYKSQIQNIINQRDQIIQDLCQLQQFIQNGQLEQAKLLIIKRNKNKKQGSKYGKKCRKRVQTQNQVQSQGNQGQFYQQQVQKQKRQQVQEFIQEQNKSDFSDKFDEYYKNQNKRNADVIIQLKKRIKELQDTKQNLDRINCSLQLNIEELQTRYENQFKNMETLKAQVEIYKLQSQIINMQNQKLKLQIQMIKQQSDHVKEQCQKDKQQIKNFRQQVHNIQKQSKTKQEQRERKSREQLENMIEQTKKIKQQIQKIREQNAQIRRRQERYKVQINRALWVISAQNREIIQIQQKQQRLSNQLKQNKLSNAKILKNTERISMDAHTKQRKQNRPFTIGQPYSCHYQDNNSNYVSANSENMSSNLKVYRKNESTKKTNPLRFMSGNTNKISHSMNNSMNATGKLNRTADVSLNIGQNNNNQLDKIFEQVKLPFKFTNQRLS